MGIDLGTSSVKVVVTDLSGTIQAISRQRYSIDLVKEDVEEQNADDWLMATITAVRHIEPKVLRNIRSIAFTGQMHAVVPVDSSYRPLAKALLWFDHRAYLEVEILRAKLMNCKDSRYTHVQLDETLPLAKILWLQHQMNEQWSDIRCFLGAKDWLRCQFGGSAVTDFSEASGTQMFDEEMWIWDRYLIELAGIQVSQLPLIQSSFSIDGIVSPRMAELTGLPAGCSLLVGGGDFPCVAGLIKLKSNDVLINIGTSCQIATILPKEQGKIKESRFARVDQLGWLTVVPLLSFGMCIDWLSTIIGSDVYGKLKDVSTQNSPLLFLPQISGERSWHPHRLNAGAFLGLTSKHGPDDMVSAVIEGMVMSVKEAYIRLQEHPLLNGRIILMGTKSFTDALAKEISAALNSSIYVYHFIEPTAEGAAFLAKRSLLGQDMSSMDQNGIPFHQVEPHAQRVEWYMKYYPIYERAREANYGILNSLSSVIHHY